MITKNKINAIAAATLLSLGAAFTANASLLNQGFVVQDNIGQANVSVGSNIAQGGNGDFSWTAESRIIGSTDRGAGTAGIDEAGDPLYHPSFPADSGVVGMLMRFGNSGFVCSGTLLEDRRSIATAAHCVSSGAGTDNPDRTTVFFQPEGGLDPAANIYGADDLGQVEIEVTDYFVSDEYTGAVIDQNDIAILRLAEEAPEWAVSHALYTEDDLTGQEFTAAGYGIRGSGAEGVLRDPVTGALLTGAGTGRLRSGENMYDFAFGDEAFDGFWTDLDDEGLNFFGTDAEIEFSYLSDHDNGLEANDTSGLIGLALGTDQFVDTGLGDNEVGIGGGDSGGPNFINGLLAGVNSYGLSFGTGFGDAIAGLNNSFGEFSGFVPTWIHADFIASVMVMDEETPVSSPAALGLLGLGLGFIGWRKRKQA